MRKESDWVKSLHFHHYEAYFQCVSSSCVWESPSRHLLSGLILGLCPANERQRYFVTTSLIGWMQAQNNTWDISYWSCYIYVFYIYNNGHMVIVCGEWVVINYNMVGVAVAMVISTMHDKSCIDLHNARKFEKSSKIQSFTHLAIIMMKVRKYHSHGFLKL